MSNHVANLIGSQPWLLPTFAAPAHLQVYDLRGASRDELHTATAAAGIINRSQCQIYLVTSEDELFWLEQVFTAIPHTQVNMQGSAALHELLANHVAMFKGLIVYDPALPDTINVATTMAGLQDGLCVSPALAEMLQTKLGLPLLTDLRRYGWRNRLQAYQWAQEHLQPLCSTHVIAGLDPGAFCGLRSFLVACRAFIYWLDSRKYLPASNAKISERSLFKRILSFYPVGSVHMGWVVHEQSAVSMASHIGMTVVASDYALNMEVWSAMQTERTPRPPRKVERIQPHKEKIYLSLTMSDGDNIQYCQHRLRQLWQDPARGSLPLGWGLPPVLLQAAPAMADYYLRTATENDEIMAGPSGLGYIYPSCWPKSHIEPFVQQTGSLMQDFGMTTLDILDVDPVFRTGLPLIARFSFRGMQFTNAALQRLFAQQLADYGVTGILSGSGYTGRPGHWRYQGDFPIYHHLGFTFSVDRTVKMIKFASRIFRQRPLFLSVYLIAWNMTPSDAKQVIDQLGAEYELVLPSTLLSLLPK
ncbi:GxGYxYP domain-containing protein [Dictyobacter alpinus]|nr:GxGYxYP domain-containing protein [Dictyobacter alpinus]